MNQPIITAQLRLSSTLRDPNDADVAAAGLLLTRLMDEAKTLGESAQAAPVHHAMGRIWIERLGDPRSAAVCFQSAFQLDPKYRPNLEAARRLFASEGQWERALAVHQKEEALLLDTAARVESLRAQARILSEELRRPEQASEKVQRALAIAPEHPALLRASIEAAERAGDKLQTAKLLLRSASAIKDDVQRGTMLRRAALLFEELHAQAMVAPASTPMVTPAQPFNGSPSAAELEQLYEEALRRLAGACPGDPISSLVIAQRARAAGNWEELWQLAHAEAERTQAPAERLLAAQIAAFKQNRAQEALTELRLALRTAPEDASLRALELELVATAAPAELPEVLGLTAKTASGANERADLMVLAAMHASSALDRESLLSEALAENPGDAAAIAMHARVVAERDAHAAAERYVALAEALESHAPHEAADQYAEAGLWLERSGARDTAVSLARRALSLQPGHAPSLRLLGRELAFLGEQSELAEIFEEQALQAPPWQAAEMLSRAAALLSDLPAPGEVASDGLDSETQIAEVSPMQRALSLAERASEIAKDLSAPRGSEAWTLLALRAGDADALGRSLEARAGDINGRAGPAEVAELLIEASELSRVMGNDVRAVSLLQRARKSDPSSASARHAILHLPALSAEERVDALAEEAAKAEAARAAALHAERAAILEQLGRFAESVQACALALSSGGIDLAVLRRLARVQQRLGDHAAALAVLEQIAQELPEGPERAAAYARAAETAEWRLGDPARAEDFYAKALISDSSATFALAARARLLYWSGRFTEAAAVYEALAKASTLPGEKLHALRIAASIHAHRSHDPAHAAFLLRQLLKDEPGDLDAMAALLSLDTARGPDHTGSAEVLRERAELRGKLASRCQDPRLAALLRADSAEDRFAAGERDQGVAELRRALALNPQDRLALDLVEEALRAGQNRQVLIDHLSFRCACEEGPTRAALAVEQAELMVEEGRLEGAANTYRLALQSDPGSLLAVRGARRLAEQMADQPELMRLLPMEASLSPDAKLRASLLLEAARIAQALGENEEALQHFSSVLEHDPRNDDVAQKLRDLEGENGPTELAQLYDRVGTASSDAAESAFAWVKAGRIQLDELHDPQVAFVNAGRALARVPDLFDALLLRADAGEAISRYQEAADALVRCIALKPGAHVNGESLELRLGLLYLESLNDAKKALPLLTDHLATLELDTLLALAPHAASLEPKQSVPLYRRLVDAFPVPPGTGSPTHEELSGWIDALAQGCLALDDKPGALAAYRLAVGFEPESKAALGKLAELSEGIAPDESIAAWQKLFLLEPTTKPLHALTKLLQRKDQGDAAFVAAAILVGLSEATPEEAALHETTAKRPPAAELPSLGTQSLRASDDTGPARALLSSAAGELVKAFPTPIAGRAERIKGDNPVRRVVTALARAIGLPAEPALYLSKTEPEIVVPAAVEGPGLAPGLIVGERAPRKFSPRVQRFLYARAMAHVHHGTHALVESDASIKSTRLASLCNELTRLSTPPGTDLTRLPERDEAIAEPLGTSLSMEARTKLAPLAVEFLAGPALDAGQLALAMRESAERIAMILCGDPAAALSVVAQECPGGLSRPEVLRLARFALSPSYLTVRAR